MGKYQIFTDSCSELSTEIRKNNNIEYVRMGINVDGEEKHADLDWQEYSQVEFYDWLREGRHIKTSQVSYEEFILKFTPFLEKGIDILYIACSSALTASMNACRLASQELLRKFPGREIVGIDSLTASAIEGMLVLDAVQKQKEGLSLKECAEWVEANKFKYNQFATVDTLTYLKNAGRIKGAKAFMGNLLHKKPIFISDRKGNNFTIKTVTGTKAADEEMINAVVNNIHINESNRVVVAHGDDEPRAKRLKAKLEELIPGINCEIWWIGPIVGTTCGPGVISTFCFGEEVTRFEGDGIK